MGGVGLWPMTRVWAESDFNQRDLIMILTNEMLLELNQCVKQPAIFYISGNKLERGKKRKEDNVYLFCF